MGSGGMRTILSITLEMREQPPADAVGDPFVRLDLLLIDAVDVEGRIRHDEVELTEGVVITIRGDWGLLIQPDDVDALSGKILAQFEALLVYPGSLRNPGTSSGTEDA